MVRVCVHFRNHILAEEDTIYEMMYRINKHTNVSGVELNISCPNYKMISEQGVKRMLDRIKLQMNPRFMIGIKLPPHCSESLIKLICNYDFIQMIVVCNTIRTPFGAMSGKPLKKIALDTMKQVKVWLTKYKRNDIKIVGVGGIFHGQDVNDFLLAGASAVQVGTCRLFEGNNCFERIYQEWSKL